MASGGQVCLVVCRQELVSLCQGRPQQWGRLSYFCLCLPGAYLSFKLKLRIPFKYLILLVGAQGLRTLDPLIKSQRLTAHVHRPRLAMA